MAVSWGFALLPSGLASKSLGTLDGKRVFLQLRDEPTRAMAAARVLELGGVVTRELLESSVVVVDNVAAPGERVLWHATLRGCLVASSEMICQGRGSAVQWAAAIHTRRRLWISARFARENPRVAEIAVAAVRAPGSRWCRLLTKNAFLTSARARQRTYDTLALVTAPEKRLEDC